MSRNSIGEIFGLSGRGGFAAHPAQRKRVVDEQICVGSWSQGIREERALRAVVDDSRKKRAFVFVIIKFEIRASDPGRHEDSVLVEVGRVVVLI